MKESASNSLSHTMEAAAESKKREGWVALKELENEVIEIEMWLCMQKSETDAKRFKILEILNGLSTLKEKMKAEPRPRG